MNEKLLVLLAVVGVTIISVMFANPNLIPSDNTNVTLTNVTLTNVTLTGTPADYFPEEQRSKFCGTGNATSNNYVKEYKIPTDCTLPQAIVTDEFGNIWFVESNTGSVAKFDPVLESFTEYHNPFWPKSGHSMTWGIAYSPDGTIWFTDEKQRSVWNFNILLKMYERHPLPYLGDTSFPQRLQVQDSQLLINDFKGNRIIFLSFKEFVFASPATPISTKLENPNPLIEPALTKISPTPSGYVSIENIGTLIQDEKLRTQLDSLPPDKRMYSYALPSLDPRAVSADFTLEGETLWYTSWILDGPGSLYKYNQTEFESSIQSDGNIPLSFESFSLPTDLKTPNGITGDDNGNIWLVDSSSSLFFKFNPIHENFTQYVTSNPHKSTYGNYTGEIKSPVSRPNWIDIDSFGQLVFNEQGSNKIGILDLNNESLVEYSIPSKNPHWGDCGNIQNCGTSQILDFVIRGEKIWFTEWSENNLGVVDTTIPLPIAIHLGKDEISLYPGESYNLNFTISSTSENTLLPVSLILTGSSDFLDVQANDTPLEILLSDSIESINVTLHVDAELIPGVYKVLLGAETEQVSVSKFVTIIVKSTTPEDTTESTEPEDTTEYTIIFSNNEDTVTTPEDTTESTEPEDTTESTTPEDTTESTTPEDTTESTEP